MNKEEILQNLFICETEGKELNLPMHIFECLKNTNGEVDVETKKQLKSALSKISLSEIFNEEKFILNGSKHVILDVNNLREKQSFAVFSKNVIEDCGLINYFSSEFNDISLTSIYEQIEMISNALSGVKNRIEQKKEEIKSEKQAEELSADLLRLGKYLHWQICEEFSIRSKIDRTRLSPIITGALLIKTYILTDISQCSGLCGKVYTSSEETTNIECECGGKIVLAPPMLKVEKISFVVPEKIEEIIPSPEESFPRILFDLVNKTFLNRNLLVILNQLNSYNMRNKIALPSDAFYQYRDTKDIVRVKFIHEIRDDKEIDIFACITDTRYSDDEFLSSVSLPIIMRDISNGLRHGFDWEKIISSSELREWLVTPFIKGKELEKINSFKDIYSLLSGGKSDV